MRKRLFALANAAIDPILQRLYDGEKSRLLGALDGTVLEIGPGTGSNLPYLGAGVSWIGLEPNPHMRRRIEQRAARLGRPVDVRGGTAEATGLPSASVDAVVSTLVLCSVRDLDATLVELRRVLRPGGRLVFIEHVRSHSRAGHAAQRLFRRPWSFVADGCQLDRDTGDALLRAGFFEIASTDFRVPAPVRWLLPHISGYAIR